jgi:1,4-dihydroxy-2-naphthoyl-CoA hydrolase
MIWFRPYTLEELKPHNEVNMIAHLGLELVEIGPDYLVGRLPVDHRTKQTFGLFHGGASVVLAETLGSIGANMLVNPETHYAVGLEVNANHVRPVREGWVTGTARPLHIGRFTQVWEILLRDDAGNLSAVSRHTVAVVERLWNK